MSDRAPSLLDALEGPNEATLDGSDLLAEDHKRLTEHMARVQRLMSDGRWRTVKEIAAATGDPELSVSAQLRNLRKEKFGAYLVEKRQVANHGWVYRVGAKGAGTPVTRGPSNAALALGAARALRRYVRHRRDCLAVTTLRADGLGECDCGLDLVVAAFEETMRRVGQDPDG